MTASSLSLRAPTGSGGGSAALPVIDEAVIAELREVGSNGELLQRVIGLFGKHAPATLQRVKGFAAAGDRAELADAVHALKSLCSSMGAKRAMVLCEQIERQARAAGGAYDPGLQVQALAAEIGAALSEAEKLKTG
jgi:HPt (histidine-containing phosphotransfer) domain-containing protein